MSKMKMESEMYGGKSFKELAKRRALADSKKPENLSDEWDSKVESTDEPKAQRKSPELFRAELRSAGAKNETEIMDHAYGPKEDKTTGSVDKVIEYPDEDTVHQHEENNDKQSKKFGMLTKLLGHMDGMDAKE